MVSIYLFLIIAITAAIAMTAIISPPAAYISMFDEDADDDSETRLIVRLLMLPEFNVKLL